MAAINTGLGGAMGVGENSFLGSSLDAGNMDDGSIYVDITSVFGAGGFDFFGSSYTGIYINSNGNITLDSANTAYTPIDIENFTAPMIAPFWSDVNITSGSETGNNNIYWDIDPANGKVTITWLNVESYNTTGTNTFQLVLTDNGSGDVGIEFIYDTIGWTNGYTGSATVGVTDGGSNDFVVPGSGDDSLLATFPSDNLAIDDPNGTWDLNLTNGTPPCFMRHTLIETSNGEKPIEWLRVGDMVKTRDNGFQPVQWVGRTRFALTGDNRPVRIAAGVLDNKTDLFVSNQHRIALESPIAELLFFDHEVFVTAGDLVRAGLADHIEPLDNTVEYFHLLLDTHEVIFSNGQASESFFPSDIALSALPPKTRAVLEPLREARFSTENGLARLQLKSFEADLLLRQAFTGSLSTPSPDVQKMAA